MHLVDNNWSDAGASLKDVKDKFDSLNCFDDKIAYLHELQRENKRNLVVELVTLFLNQKNCAFSLTDEASIPFDEQYAFFDMGYSCASDNQIFNSASSIGHIQLIRLCNEVGFRNDQFGCSNHCLEASFNSAFRWAQPSMLNQLYAFYTSFVVSIGWLNKLSNIERSMVLSCGIDRLQAVARMLENIIFAYSVPGTEKHKAALLRAKSYFLELVQEGLWHDYLFFNGRMLAMKLAEVGLAQESLYVYELIHQHQHRLSQCDSDVIRQSEKKLYNSGVITGKNIEPFTNNNNGFIQ